MLEEARERVAGLLGAEPAEVIFTSGGTESDSLAVLGAARGGGVAGGVIVSAIEHPAVLETARLLAAEGHPVSFAPVGKDGVLADGAIDGLLSPAARVVSLMWVNNETGVVQPVADMVAAAHQVGALAHSDAVQAAPHLELNFASSGLDLLSISGHKFGAPVGTGVLLARRDVTLVPVTVGGGQERGIRSGTVDVAGAVALAAALGEAVEQRGSEAARLAGLRDRIGGALAALPGVRVTGSGLAASQRAPGIVHAVIEGARSEDLLFALDRLGMHASAGSACRAGVHQPSHVILAMGGTWEESSGTLRCSLGWSTTEADVDALIDALPVAVERARAAGTFR